MGNPHIRMRCPPHVFFVSLMFRRRETSAAWSKYDYHTGSVNIDTSFEEQLSVPRKTGQRE